MERSILLIMKKKKGSKNLVRRIYTQNVDGLELKAGVPYDKIVFAHVIIVGHI